MLVWTVRNFVPIGVDGHVLRSWPRTTVHLPFPRLQRTANTDPSWQSTKTGYYRTHTPSRPIRRGCFLLSRYVRNFFSGHGILSHLASIVLLFPLEWPRTAVHLPFPRCRQPHRAHWSFVAKHEDRVLPDATDNITDLGRNRRWLPELMLCFASTAVFCSTFPSWCFALARRQTYRRLFWQWMRRIILLRCRFVYSHDCFDITPRWGGWGFGSLLVIQDEDAADDNHILSTTIYILSWWW